MVSNTSHVVSRRSALPLLALSFITTAFALISAPRQVSAQSIFDRLGNQVKQQFEQELQRTVPGIVPKRQTPPSIDRPRALGGIPGEGGQQNNNGGFGPGDFFRPGTGGGNPTPGQGGVRPGGGSYIPPSSLIPSNGYPGSSYPGSSYPGSTPGTTVYREPPVAAGDFNGGTIKIRCPKNSSQSVTYRLILGGKSFAYTMRPGESQSFTENKLWLIRYINGTEEVTYRLRGNNVYSFETRGGTRLFRDDESLNEFPEPPTRDGN
ncbi:MAG: hypothetical protein Aurels2KO_03660 [Aureliella sp.]